jgi:hypothetical protein
MGVFDAFKTVYNFLKPITSKAFDGIKAAFDVIKKPVDLLITALRKAKELFQWFTSIGGGKNTPTVAIGPTTPGTGLPPGFKVQEVCSSHGKGRHCQVPHAGPYRRGRPRGRRAA